MNKLDFVSLVERAFKKDALKKLVFSRPKSGEVKKISCRMCSHRGRRVLSLESYLPGDTVSQKNAGESELFDTVSGLFDQFSQINLYTTLGDAEYKSKKDKTVFLGADKLSAKLSGDALPFERAIEELDRRKNYILTGREDFLIKLGISSEGGRVHDKKQGKFRQINRFLEHIENIYENLPQNGTVTVYDLCSGKSYLGFAVYYYLTAVKGREVSMLSVDLKRDVVLGCERLATELGFRGMRFLVSDIKALASDGGAPDMVISLHACDVATDIVLDTAVRLGAGVILSTPCCHRYLSRRIKAESLSFVTDYPHLSGKLCEVLTDAIRLARLRKEGYTVSALELTDPENTPKNTLIRAVRCRKRDEGALARFGEEYDKILQLLLGEEKENYLKDI